LEKPIEPGDSWFSAKSIEVKRKIDSAGWESIPLVDQVITPHHQGCRGDCGA